MNKIETVLNLLTSNGYEPFVKSFDGCEYIEFKLFNMDDFYSSELFLDIKNILGDKFKDCYWCSSRMIINLI